MSTIKCPYCGKEFITADSTVGAPVPSPSSVSRERITAEIQIKLAELQHAREKYDRDECDWYDRPQSHDRSEPGYLTEERGEVGRLEAEIEKLKGQL